MDKQKRKSAEPTLAIAVKASGNSKIGPIAATYASQGSCPESCPFQGSGCYAESGTMAFTTNRLNRAFNGQTPEEIALVEATAIDNMGGYAPLRLHAVGDCKTNRAARIVAGAARRYTKRTKQPVYTYTHAWQEVDRDSWLDVSVLASCENPLQVLAARARGYATAMVVDSHPTNKLYERDGVKILPCPQQTGKTENCSTCRLCWDSEKLREREITIGFAAHGARANSVKDIVSSITESASVIG